ncbi:MAG: hypothetical protein EA340_13060 [Nitriliruptor sp.]|nr:MAG: hypothetical protein EA340_13060 [Nitriliruptor sp.]
MSWQPPERDAFLELGDAARVDEEIAARGERRSRLSRAREVATWDGTLEDLAEHRQRVIVRLAGGRSYLGALVALGRDHVAVRASGGQVVLVRASAIRSLRPEPGSPAAVAAGDRERSEGRTLVDVIGRLAEERARVVLGLEDVDELLAGVLLGLGEDVITLRVEPGEAGVVYVPTAAVRELLLDP